jgi:hypothetical protein
MSEKLKPNPFSRDVQAVQKWLEVEIVEAGLCPPLVILMQRYRNPDGLVNWMELSKEVKIDSLSQKNPRKASFITEVAELYLGYIIKATQEAAPLTQVLIFPEFDSNFDYDRFMYKMKMATLLALSAPAVLDSTVQAFNLGLSLQQRDLTPITKENLAPEQIAQVAFQVIEGLFNPVYFYGKELTAKTISDITEERGDKKRAKVLSRAPYYITQFINPFAGRDLSEHLNKPKLYQRNTTYALSQNMQVFEKRMNKLKK